MKKKILEEAELKEFFTLSEEEKNLAKRRHSFHSVVFIVLYKIYANTRRDPKHFQEIPKKVFKYVAQQLQVVLSPANSLSKRTRRHFLQQIRQLLSLKKRTIQDKKESKEWLISHVLIETHDYVSIQEHLDSYLQQKGFESLSFEEEKKEITSSLVLFESHFFTKIFKALSPHAITSLFTWLDSHQTSSLEENGWVGLTQIKKNPGPIRIRSVFTEVKKLYTLSSFALPPDLLSSIHPKIIRKYYHRARVQSIWEFKRFSKEICCGLLALFFSVKQQKILDDIIELFLQIVHKIRINAEKRVKKNLIQEVQKIYGKEKILLEIAVASLHAPEKKVEEVIYPVVGGEERLQALVKDLRSARHYKAHVHFFARKSYSFHYRQILPQLLDVLSFQCNNKEYQPILEAVRLIKKYMLSKKKWFSTDEHVPIEGVIPKQLVPLLLEKHKGKVRINRMSYEICTLRSLRDRVRCKEIWVKGAHRYRNPDQDLPQDFEQEKTRYYGQLRLPLCVEQFLTPLKKKLEESLFALNAKIPSNPRITLTKKQGGSLFLSPLDAQPESTHLNQIKAQLARTWPMISLLDILKETFLRASLTPHFKSIATRELLSSSLFQKRLILTVYGIGTNTGLKRVALGNPRTQMKHLFHVYQNHLTKENLRTAIGELVNHLFRIREPKVWGETTTACASDSKQFGAWDQNLITEWHNRYHGRGVMIYWHVEKNSMCIHSQLKRCSSSEVAAMMEGVLHHCTQMEIERNYVDTHGQSVVAFAFCYLLGFKLCPRFKSFSSQKLSLPRTGLSLPYLEPILAKKTINWSLIAQQYNQMVCYATALKTGTAETEALLKRFTRENVKHPTYLALCELGKVEKTIFLCTYLLSESLQHETQEGLNVIENWNGTNTFVLFGKGHEFTSNDFEVQEVTALCLHLIQNSIVYINTLMLQEILHREKWLERMTQEDFRALTPLLYEHITPYGSFHLNMHQRLPLVA